eukprot:scaffold31724_cov30-Prasinocladus_malaysianus.AAC.1
MSKSSGFDFRQPQALYCLFPLCLSTALSVEGVDVWVLRPALLLPNHMTQQLFEMVDSGDVSLMH